MARYEVDGMSGLEATLARLASAVDTNGEAALEAGAGVAVEALKNAVPVKTGALRDHIKMGKIKRDAGVGLHTDIAPTGTRSDGQRYAAIGFILEYGRSNMPARPWLRPTMERERERITEAMRVRLMEGVETE